MVTQNAADPNAATYRVVQWATGNVGTRALRRAIEHPGLELVGLYVHSAEKLGRDAGEIAGLGPVGVKATNNIDDIIALKPDCVLYMPLLCNFDEVCRLLESGINIVTTRGEFLNPLRMDPAMRARVEEACRRGNSSIHSTGSSPGFVSEALPLVLATMQRSIRHIAINEFADCSSRDSPLMIFDIMGFGRKPGGSIQGRLDYLRQAFGPSLEVTAAALGLPCDAVAVSGGVGLAKRDTRIAAGVIPAGTVAAQRTVVSAMRGGRKLITFAANWYVSTELDTPGNEHWDLRESGWHIVVDGDAPLDVVITYPVAVEDYAEMTPGLTAHRPLNIVPFLCAASPGIKTSADLPQILPRLGEM